MPPKNIYENTPSLNAQPVVQVPKPTPNAPVSPPPPKRDFPKILVVIGAILIVLLLIFLAFNFLMPRSGPSGQITWWGLWEDPAVVAPLISTYEQGHPGVKINYIKQSPQDYRERLSNSLAKGAGPDIFTFHNSWAPMLKRDLDALPASVINPADFAKTFYSVVSSDLAVGNSIVGIPLEYDGLALYINEDVFNQAGKTPPTTWDDLRVLAREMTVKDDKGAITQSGVALGRTENVDHWPEILALLMLQNSVDLGNPIGKPAEDALTFFTIFSSTDRVWDETLPSSTQAFAAGKVAMYIAPSWRSFEIEQQNPNLKFKTVPIPQLPKDNPNQPDITYATYWVQGVWARSNSKEAAWDFLKFLSTQDSLQKLYKNESGVRAFGEPYPRADMASLLSDHPIIWSIIKQAPGAQSWYLASRTFDGPTGINSQVNAYFADAVNAVADGKQSTKEALSTCAQGIKQVLVQYGLAVQ